MKRDVECMLSEVRKSREICQYYQKEENEYRKQRDEYILRIQEVKLLHDDLINNKLGEIDRLKSELQSKEDRCKNEVKRVNALADWEMECRKRIENDLRAEIKELKDELCDLKTVMRYKRLYFKFYGKKYGEFKDELKLIANSGDGLGEQKMEYLMKQDRSQIIKVKHTEIRGKSQGRDRRDVLSLSNSRNESIFGRFSPMSLKIKSESVIMSEVTEDTKKDRKIFEN